MFPVAYKATVPSAPVATVGAILKSTIESSA